MSEVHVTTELGTRILLATEGSSVHVTKDESEVVKITVRAADGSFVTLALSHSECMSLIEFLAIAARPGSGRPIVELPEGEGVSCT